jgi:hypothetical protein
MAQRAAQNCSEENPHIIGVTPPIVKTQRKAVRLLRCSKPRIAIRLQLDFSCQILVRWRALAAKMTAECQTERGEKFPERQSCAKELPHRKFRNARQSRQWRAAEQA